MDTTQSARKGRGIGRAQLDIVEAAARAFAKRGVHGTTMENVANEAREERSAERIAGDVT